MRIRLHNPRRRRSRARRHHRTRRGSSSAGALTRAFKSGMREASKMLRRRNRAAGGGELTIMRNRKKNRRHRRRYNMRRHRRRRNPVVLANRSHRVNRHRRYRRRNPGIGDIKRVSISALWAIGAGVGTNQIPQMLLKEQNVGVMGYLANAVTALGLSALVGRFVNPAAGESVFIGGAVMTAGRMIQDFLGYQAVTFGTFPFLSGEFVPQSFPVPYSSLPEVVPAGLPAPVAAAPAALSGPWASPWNN